jgi:hypothetical protein
VEKETKMIRTGVTLDKDQVMMNMAREHAIAQEGRKFITLRLLDFTKNRIQGAIVLHAQSYRDANGMPKFHFEERGGPIVFELDELQGAMFARVLDIEHNRRFLASMSSYNIWEIEDKTIEAEILEIAKGMTKKAVVEKSVKPKEQVLSDEQLELEMAKLEGEKSRRKLQKAKDEQVSEIHDVVAPEIDVVPEVSQTTEVQEITPKEPQKRGRAARRRLVSVE